MNQDKFSLKSRLGSFKFAVHGLMSLIKNEHNSRIHLLAAFAAIIIGIILNLNQYEWALLIVVIGIVFISELLNSSIESLADHINPEWNELIRRAKDYSAAAVLVSAVIAIVVGALIFLPRIIALL
jgi:diacylglycerol kinase